jgi:hypothetical protein
VVVPSLLARFDGDFGCESPLHRAEMIELQIGRPARRTHQAVATSLVSSCSLSVL